MARRRGNPYARPDHHTRSAKAAGYPARSVYKLEEIDHRVGLLRAGQSVLDLGAAPGSWSKYALERIGSKGRLLAVDLDPLTGSLGGNAHVLQADVRALGDGELGQFAPYQVVLSDMAPRTTGTRSMDAWRSHELFCTALDCAEKWLETGGNFVGKLFMGEGFEDARTRMRLAFRTVRVLRPESTRSVSHEVFLVGLERKQAEPDPMANGPAAAGPAADGPSSA